MRVSREHIMTTVTDAGPPGLGACTVCFKVRDVKRSSEFYAKLGFCATAGSLAENWVVMEQGNLKLGLFQGHIESNLLNFRGGNVFAIARHLEAQGLKLRTPAQVEPDGSAGATIADPDGNIIYFNTAPGEEADG
jgi:lactoylglutathione lyase